MSRIDSIKAFRENEDIKAANAEIEKRVQTEGLIRQIQALKPRIDELLETANACVKNGIEIDKYGSSTYRDLDKYEKGTFVTNSISHKVGFVKSWGINTKGPREFTLLGINAGGACGRWDFRTDGVNVFSADESNRSITSAPLIRDMKEFLEEFDGFESAFYNYVDNIIGRSEPVEPLRYEDFATVEVDAERLKVLLYNAISCLENYECDGGLLQREIGITQEEYDFIMDEPDSLDKVIAKADAQREENQKKGKEERDINTGLNR